MEGLPKRKEHLGTFFGSHASPKNCQHLPQKPSRKTDSNISISGLCFAYGQTNNPDRRKIETRAIDRMC